MKKNKIIFVIAFLFILFNCFSQTIDKRKTKKKSKYLSYNKTDNAGLCQGFWIISIPSDGGHRFNTLEGIYFNNKKVGVWNLKKDSNVIIEQYIYYDTFMHSVQFNEYFLNNNIKSSGFKNQVFCRDTVFAYNEKNDKMDIPIYINSILMKQGKWSYYFENGHIKEEGLYEKDKKKGTWKIYSETGQLIKTEEY